MTLKELLALNGNDPYVTMGICNEDCLLYRGDKQDIPTELMNKKVTGWFIEEGQEVVIEIED